MSQKLENILKNHLHTKQDIYSAKKLETALIAFSNITELPVTFYDPEGNILWEHLTSSKICYCFPSYCNNSGKCHKELLAAFKISDQLGEPYTFVCHDGLANITIPFLLNSVLCGYITTGPILMNELKDSLVSKIITNHTLETKNLSKMILFMKNMEAKPPKHISYICSLFECVVLASLNGDSSYTHLNLQYAEQRRISKELHKNKKIKRDIHYPYELEDSVLQAVKTGNINDAEKYFKQYFDELSVSEFGNLAAIQTKVWSLNVLLERTIASGHSDITFNVLEEFNQIDSLSDLYQFTSKLIIEFCHKAQPFIYKGKSKAIHSALEYVNNNYSKKITLKEIADRLHVNPSYLSMLFKQETGSNYSEYVNLLRITKCKTLLLNSNKSLAEISDEVGFDDQSYFSKKFKSITGTTPSEYRKIHISNSNHDK